MNLPRDYDAWRLSGPEEDDDHEEETCPACDGEGCFERENTVTKCGRCSGTGMVEIVLDEPDGDYEYERRRDAAWEADR